MPTTGPIPESNAGTARRLITGASLSLLGLLAALLLCELAVRVMRLGPLPLAIFRAHPTRMFTLAEGKDALFVDEEFTTRVTIGPDGLRHPPLAPAASASRPRILALGDSFTFGYGVEMEESWPWKLQEELREEGFPGAEVINAGVVAYGPDQELDLLRELLPRLRPDLVILGLYVGNDPAEILLHRNAPPMVVSAEGALLERPSADDLQPGPVRAWLARNSRLYGFARVRVHRLLIKLGLREVPSHFHPAYFLDALGYTDAYEENWRELEKILLSMDRETERAGAKFLLAIVPMDVQVAERYWDYYNRLGFQLDRAILAEDRVQERLEAFAGPAGIATIDLLPAFRSHRGGRLFFHRNPHWTPLGHAVAADALAPAVSGALRAPGGR